MTAPRLLGIMLALALGAAADDGQEPFTGEISLVLDGAVFQERAVGGIAPKNLFLELEARGGRWEHAWGWAPSFNQGQHRGRVVAAEVTADRVKLELALRAGGDPWIPGGRGRYAADLARKGRMLEGSFTGTFRGRDASGRAGGEILPPRPSFAEPAGPGEHPRLLFRKGDLPALRKKAGTPFGKKVLEGIRSSADDAVAMGFLYQIEGDRSRAEKARLLVEKMILLGGQAGPFNLPHAVGERLGRVAMTYDLCYDAWEPECRARVEQYMSHYIERCVLRPHLLSQKTNFSVSSNYGGPLNGGAALAGLALWMEKGPAPEKPPDPGEQPYPAAAAPLEAMASLEPDRTPSSWICSGPFEGRADDGIFDLLGGPEKAQPRAAATELVWKDRAIPFKPLDPALVSAEKGVDVQAILKGLRESTTVYFTVVENAEPRVLQARYNYPSLAVWVGGRRVTEGDYVRFEKGNVPLLVRHTLANPYAPLFLRFVPVDAKAMEADLAARAAEHREALEDWKADRETWERTGGADPEYLDKCRYAGLQAVRYFRTCMGDGGWQTEGESYTAVGSENPLMYAHGHRTMFGRDASGRPDVPMFLPRYVAQMVFPGGGKPPYGQSLSLVDGGGMNARKYARGFSSVPDGFKPAVLWAWNHWLGVEKEGAGPEPGKDADDMEKALSLVKSGAFAGETGVFTFLNYPLDLEPRNPEGCLPKAWEAPTRAGYIFRDGWKGADDIVAMIHFKGIPPGGWSHPDAGSFRIYGLGRRWAVMGPGNSKSGSRWYENVVMLAEDDVHHGAGGRVVHYEGNPDGSGVVTADLGLLYRGIKTGPDRRGKVGPLGVGDREFRWEPQNAEDLGIRGLRSFMADYSGKSGAPGLFAVVDRIEGGKSKVWMWQLPAEDPRGVDDLKVELEERGFTLTGRDGASLRAVFLAPADVKIEVVREKRRLQTGHGRFQDYALSAIHATGPEGAAGDFFVVMTLQKGAPPEVHAEGRGLDASARVGGRNVSFDGQKIRFGE